MTKDDDTDKMPPPLIPIGKTKSTRARGRPKKDDSKSEDVVLTATMIKKEKVSIETNQTITNSSDASCITVTTQSTICETSSTTKTKKGKANKKYPMPIQVKMEPEEPEQPAPAINDETFDVPKQNAPAMNETVTLTKQSSERNMHESLMTEDNSDDEDNNGGGNTFVVPGPPKGSPPPPPLPPKKQQNKNEVFNPYIASPIKQKIQAFEKHAHQAATPEKYKTLPSSTKFSSLKSGTPSKIALFGGSGRTTPSAATRSQQQKFGSCSTLPSSTGKKSATKLLKKAGSVSQESLETEKAKINGMITALSHQQALDEKKRQRDEKQKAAALQRELIEKEKRENALRLQLEREEKVRKNLKEKEDRLRLEALKKKAKKENQLKKLNEEHNQEKLKDREVYEGNQTAQLNATSSNPLNNSLLVKMQKQKMDEQRRLAERELLKNTYCFDMLHTDDSTDDEGTQKPHRPPPPNWSRSELNLLDIFS